MGKNTKLIIVESPTKAKTIAHFLDHSYEVIASKGHVRDLNKYAMGIKVQDNKFVPKYTIDKGHEEIVAQILQRAKSAQEIYIATDEDREGEAIGYHIAYLIDQAGHKSQDPLEEMRALEDQSQTKTPHPIFTFPRIVFHEITKSAILHALKHPKTLDVHKINAQLARRLLDRIVGFSLSSLLASKISKGMSAGRVQSAALKLVVDREREIRAFEPIIYYEITGAIAQTSVSLQSYQHEKIKKQSPRNKQEALEIVANLRAQTYQVQEISTKEKNTPSPPPFMTSTLQQSASNQLGYSPSKTMGIAQKLYEGVMTPEGVSGVITYMRTDSLNIAKEAIESARTFIEQNYGAPYVPKKPKVYTSKNKSAQEAHEAIRPTNLAFTPTIAKNFLKLEEHKVYTLIYQRFLASQMSDARLESQSVYFACESLGAVFKASGHKLLFEGFYKVLGNGDKDTLLPSFELHQGVRLESLEAKECSTQPPARYSEASLIKTLESLGIGRPSTYAPTIALLLSRDYVSLQQKQLTPTPNAFSVIEILEKHFSEIVNAAFSAGLEDKLDAIASHELNWQEMLLKFYTPFMAQIEEGKIQIVSQKVSAPTGELCPKCGAPLVQRTGRYGVFVACSAYPKCKFIKSEISQTENLGSCEKCGEAMVRKRGRFGEFVACSAYPTCKNIRNEETKNTPSLAKCPECGGDVRAKRGKRGIFYGCDNYPNCKFISNYQPVLEPCLVCGGLRVFKVYKKKPSVQECLKCHTKIEIESEQA
ncbi:type I DNA topoisomerase [Helicobacter cynogastricus]|uniref:type I DNA topoisomerase n=1 Tax=Helicobacter cynogastricus TaxID=329937 RepID=UPI000CF018E7|nr:type I DNA topoisomerase [Helicobacter cynogastricus]